MSNMEVRVLLSGEHKDSLEQKASNFGYVKSTKGKPSAPNISALMRAIAEGDIVLVLVKAPIFPLWHSAVWEYVEKKQPFSISYSDVQDRHWEYTVRYAEFKSRNYRPGAARLYLDCWCEETYGNADIPNLQHNWVLRPDKIGVVAAVNEVSGEWRDSLDFIEAELELYGGLAHGYEGHVDDISLEKKGDVLYIRRRVTSSYWFIREILPYGLFARVVAPNSLVERIGLEINKMADYYTVAA